MSRLVVISNRVPSLERGNAEAGGLATGLRAALKRRGGVWFGWSGRIDDGAANTAVRQHHPFVLLTTDLSTREHDHYYLGFANRVLWPALHGRSALIHFRRDDYATYVATNARLADEVMPSLRPSDTTWIHDYHLIPLGRELRARGMHGPIGFFLHTPFPSADVMSAVPPHRDLIGSLADYDLLGFQSHNDLANFRDYVRRHLDGAVRDDGLVEMRGRTFRAGVFPIGIDVPHLRTLATAAPDKVGRSFDPWLRARAGLIGVDRLDYTKGLLHRFRAYDRLLHMRPELAGRIFMLQIAAPSREAIDDYKALRRELQGLAGSINSRHGDIDWTPIHYINRSVAQAKLALLYRRCPVAVVTPLRDGMNLVAKEYVAAQDPANPGVLILSCFAGAAERMSSALIVNPFDLDAVAEAMAQAVDMPVEERRERWIAAMAEVERHDVHDWCECFLSSLQRAPHRDVDPLDAGVAVR